MSKRAAQIASEMHRSIQAVLDRGLQDPRASGALLTVTDVRIGDDLRNATIMVSIMPESRQELAMHGLRSAARHIRRQVGTMMEIRQMPELAFKLDKSIRKQVDVLEAIARATAEREAAERAAGAGPASGDGPDAPAPSSWPAPPRQAASDQADGDEDSGRDLRQA
jgi:ribosome-binding factor A